MRIGFYATRSIVKDAEAIRHEIIGGRTWNVFGQSSGGEVVYRYIEVAPGGIRSAFVHGSSLMSDPIEWIKLRLASQRRVAAQYFRRYPGDEELLAQVRALITPDTCFSDGTSRVCGPAVIDAVSLYLGYRNSWQALHHQISGFFLTGPDGLQRGLNRTELRRFVRNAIYGVFLQNDYAASVITQREKLAGVVESGPTDPLGCRRARERLAAEGTDPAGWAIDECRLLTAIRSPWDPVVRRLSGSDPILISRVLRGLRAQPGIDLYVYAGEYDTFSPTESYHEQQEALGDHMTFRKYAGSGHEGYYTEATVWSDISRHLHPLIDFPDFRPSEADFPF